MTSDRSVLMYQRLAAICEALRAGPENADSLWQQAARDYATTEAPDAEVKSALDSRDVAAFQKILSDWLSDRKPLPVEDRTLLKRAMKMFRKRMKFTRLDDESRLGVGATTKGESSAIVGIMPPVEHPIEVWDELVRQKRLGDADDGMYGLVD